MEDLLPADSDHDGEEDGEVPPRIQKTRCNKAAEDEYLEEITKTSKWQKTKNEHFCFSDVSPKCYTKVFGENDEGTSEVNS